MAPRLKNATICFSGTFEASIANLQKWTEANGGTFNRKLSSSTTHLVVTEANWRARVPEVKAALDSDIKIIDYEWFDDKLRTTGRVSENKYLWTTIDAERLKQEAKEARATEREKKRAEKEKERKKKDSERINYADAFMQHTNEVANISDEEASEDEGSSEEDAAAQQHSVLAEKFAKGAKQAKEDLMSDNYHIYMDNTGFSYDIVVTKASVELSRLDRARITLYETNANPHAYAVFVKIPAYIPVDKYDVTTVQNVNFPTALKCLSDNFKAFTGVRWEERVKKFTDSPSLAPLPRPRITVVAPGKNSHPGKLSKVTKKGKTGAKTEEESPEEKLEKMEAALRMMKYRYRLPAEREPRGAMADGSHYTHQDNKTAYDLFGKAADRSHEAIAAKEAFKEEVKRLRRLELKKQSRKQDEPMEVVVIDSDDEEEEEEDEGSEQEESQGEDEEMEDGYVAVKTADRDVEMQMNDCVDSVESGVEQEDYTMVDAATTQT